MTVLVTAIGMIIAGLIAHLITIPLRGVDSGKPMSRKEVHSLITKVVVANALVIGLPMAALIGLASGVA